MYLLSVIKHSVYSTPYRYNVPPISYKTLSVQYLLIGIMYLLSVIKHSVYSTPYRHNAPPISYKTLSVQYPL